MPETTRLASNSAFLPNDVEIVTTAVVACTRGLIYCPLNAPSMTGGAIAEGELGIVGRMLKLSIASLLTGLCISSLSGASADSLDTLRRADPERKIQRLENKIGDLREQIKDLKVQLRNAPDLAYTEIDQELRESAQNGDEMWVGDGIPPTGFLIQEIDGIEIGLKFHLRNGPDIPITAIDDQGRFHVTVPAGLQPGTEASPRAKWNFAFSVDSGPHGLAALLGEARIRLDVDPGAGTNFVGLSLTQIGADPEGDDNGWGWETQAGVDEINDDEGTQSVTQNSYNYAFTSDLPGGGSYDLGPGEFEIQLLISDDLAIRTVVHVETSPSPRVAKR